jgi:predicted dehydrogenase
VAQIGIGHDHADVILDSLLAQDDIFDVIGYCVCDGEEEKFQKVCDGMVLGTPVFKKAKRLSVEEILNYPDLEAVVIESEEKNLVKYAIMALDKGLHVHMDKPGSENPDEYQRAASIAKRKGLVFHMGYMYRYNPAIMRMHELVKSGELGEIYSCEAHMSIYYDRCKRQWLDKFQSGMMFFLGCHLVDLVFGFQGIPEEIVPFNAKTGFDNVDVTDYGMAVLKYKNGISFVKSTATELGGGMRRQVVLCGEKGTIELKPTEMGYRHSYGRKNMRTIMYEIRKGDDRVERTEIGPFNRYDAMMKSFSQMVNGERKNPYSYEYEVTLHRMIMKACGMDIDYKKEIIL